MATTPVSINDATALGSALAADKIPVSRSGNLTPTTITAANVAALATKATVGLGNCDNTSDANKPISTAAQAALDGLTSIISESQYSDLKVGTNAMHDAESSTFANVAVGINAGYSLVTGNTNTFLGTSAGQSLSQKTDVVDSVAIGNGSYTTKDHQVQLGSNSSTEFKFGACAITLNEMFYLQGVTSDVQTQINTKAPIDNTALTGNISATLTAADNDLFNVKDSGGTGLFTVDATGNTGTRGKATVGSLAIGATDVTATAAELNIMDGVTATAAEINVLDGIPATLTSTELGYVDGVTSAIQTQIDAKLTNFVENGSLEGSFTNTGATVKMLVFDSPTVNNYVLVNDSSVRLVSLGDIYIAGTTTTIVGLQTFANNAAAITGGLTAGQVYKTSTGVLMVVY